MVSADRARHALRTYVRLKSRGELPLTGGEALDALRAGLITGSEFSSIIVDREIPGDWFATDINDTRVTLSNGQEWATESVSRYRSLTVIVTPGIYCRIRAEHLQVFFALAEQAGARYLNLHRQRLAIAAERLDRAMKNRCQKGFGELSVRLDQLFGAIQRECLAHIRPPNMYLLYAPLARFPYATLAVNDLDRALVTEWLEGNTHPRRVYAMTAARLAEHAVRRWLSELGIATEDTSALQVTSPNNTAWLSADLRETGIPRRLFDVKHTIRSRVHLKHTVKKFKRDSAGQDVVYVGAWTHGWLSDVDQVRLVNLILGESGEASITSDDNGPSVVVLGVTDRKRLAALADFVRLNAPGIDFPVLDGLTEVPPYAWELPDDYVPIDIGRRFASWRSHVADFDRRGQPWVPWAAAIAEAELSPNMFAEPGRDEVFGVKLFSSSERTIAICDDVVRRLNGQPLTLGRAYIALLQHFIDHYADGALQGSASDEPRSYLTAVRIGLAPLVWDPTHLLHDLALALDMILQCSEHSHEAPLQRIRRITLYETGTVVAHGVTLEGTVVRRTLLARCAKCWEYPLIAGQSRICECGGLVCSHGHCRKGCKHTHMPRRGVGTGTRVR